VQAENARIHEAMVEVEEKNRLLKDENDAVKDVNHQLRNMQNGDGFVPALPQPLAYQEPGGYPGGFPGAYPALMNPRGYGLSVDGQPTDMNVVPYLSGGMYADPYGYHNYGVPSQTLHYQEMLQSHAKMEHDRYLEAREKVIAEAETAQTELLKREEELAKKEAAYNQYLQEREQFLQKAKHEQSKPVSAFATGEYPFSRTRFQESKSPFRYEQTLLQKSRMDDHIKKYTEELALLEAQRSKFDEELSTMHLQ